MLTHSAAAAQRHPELWARLARGEWASVLARVVADGDDADCHHAAALAHERLGDAESALRCCARALERDAEHLGARLTRASVHAARGERMSALASLDEVRARAPHWAAAQHLTRSLGGGDFSAPLHGEVVELFDRYAPRFEAHLVDELGYSGHVVVPRAALAALPGAQPLVVVDLGCGSGLCAPALHASGRLAHLTGVDLSPRMIAQAAARQHARYDVLYAADLVYALATSASSSVDLLVAADVLGYLGDLGAAFDEAARVLRPGGALAFSVEAAPAHVERFALQPSRRCCYALAWLHELAAAHGLGVVHHEAAALRREAGRAVEAHVLVLVADQAQAAP